MTPALRRTRLAFLWLALIPVAFTFAALWIGDQFQSEIAWITHTYEVRTAIRDSVTLTWNAERSLRNYLLTGKQSCLQSMEEDASHAPKRLEELRSLTADSPIQQRNLDRFAPLVNTSLAGLRQSLDLREAAGVLSAFTPAEIARNEQLLDQIRDVSREMQQEEERLLLARGRTGSRMVWQAQFIFALAIFLTMLLLFRAGHLAKEYAAERNGAELALQQKVAEVETLNRDLERRVEERTAALRASNEELRWTNEARRLLASIVESSNDAIIGQSLDGVIRTWNAGAERLYGYTAEEIVGRDIRELAPADRFDEESRIIEKLRQGERVDHFETVRLRKGGERIEISLTSSPILDEGGQIVGASQVARDITEQKRTADLMRQSQKLESLGVLAGGIAHDFNNLLTGVLGNASLALDRLPPESPARTAIQEVVSAGQKAAALTRQMLAYSGRGRFVLECIDLSDHVRETLLLIQAAIPRTVELRMDLAEDLPAIEADAAQVQQLVMNLVINGAQAIPDGKPGTVTIATRWQPTDERHIHSEAGDGAGQLQPGLYVLLEVRDTGSGMDDATKARIFEPFFSTKFTGRGLGLAAVLGIVRGHSGSIQVSSTPGNGTEFRVLFPAVAAAPASQPEPREARDLTGHGVVLVIDDEPIVRRMAQQALEHYGYTVLLAEDGKRALEVFSQNAVEIRGVVLDLTMPVMSGEETLARLKSLRGDIPVILSSGFGEIEAMRRFEGKGVAGFIQKPYRASTLLEKIKDVIACAGSTFRADGS